MSSLVISFLLPIPFGSASGQPTPTSNTNQLKSMLVAFAHDLKGLVSSLNTRESYQMLLNWFHPAGFNLLRQVLALWPLDPLFTVPVWNLYAELVDNKAGRLLFHVNDPTCYLLVRELSKAIQAFGKCGRVSFGVGLVTRGGMAN